MRIEKLANRITWLGLVLMLGLSFQYSNPRVLAQSNPGNWSQPVKITDGQKEISEPTIVADAMGIVHLFWAQPYKEQRHLIYYTRWDGTAWTEIVDVIAMDLAGAPSAAIDKLGNLHLIWRGDGGRLFHSWAPYQSAGSARGWSQPSAFADANMHAQITCDQEGKLHIAFPGPESSGLYYMVSWDSGLSWSVPIKVSPPSSESSSVDFVRLAVGLNGWIHVVWSEFQFPEGWPPVGVFYARSIDGGKTWSDIVQLGGPDYDQINVALVNENSIHVAWNGMVGIGGRYHRGSSDGGQIWSEMVEVTPKGFGGTEGVPQLVVDALGTVHLLTTHSGCVWYSTWQDKYWSIPECISGEKDKDVNFIEEPALAVNLGNQLHAVFWNHRSQLWYTAKQTAAPNLSMPPPPMITINITKEVAPTVYVQPTASNSPLQAIVLPELERNGSVTSTGPGRVIILSILPIVLIVAGIVLFRIRGRGH